MPTPVWISRIRASIGNDLLLVPVVAVLVRDAQGRLLLVRHRDSGAWGLPAGHVELGESPRATAIREVHEETGLSVTDLTLVDALGGPAFRYVYPNGDHCEYSVFVFEATLEGAAVPAPRDVEEITEVGFFARDDAPPLRIPWPEALLWRHAPT